MRKFFFISFSWLDDDDHKRSFTVCNGEREMMLYEKKKQILWLMMWDDEEIEKKKRWLMGAQLAVSIKWVQTV